MTDETLDVLKKIASAVGDLGRRMDAFERRGGAVPDGSDGDFGAAMRANETARADLQRRDAMLALRMREAGPQSDADRRKCTDFQVRADAAYHSVGKGSVPPPFSMEPARTYKARILSLLQCYSPELKNISLSGLPEDMVDKFGEQIFADAAAEAKSPKHLPPTGFLERKKVTESGHKVTDFYGRESFIKNMMPPVRFAKIIDPRAIKLRELLSKNDF